MISSSIRSFVTSEDNDEQRCMQRRCNRVNPCPNLMDLLRHSSSKACSGIKSPFSTTSAISNQTAVEFNERQSLYNEPDIPLLVLNIKPITLYSRTSDAVDIDSAVILLCAVAYF